MTHIRSTIVAALLVFGGAALASAQQPAPAPTPAPTPAPQHAQQHAHRARRARGHRGMFARNIRRQLFKGITLSDAEKANLKSVQAKYAPQMKALRAQMKPQLEAARAARQRGDTAALKQMWSKSAAQRGQVKTLLESERNDLRAALTPADQAKFDANVKRLEQRVAARATKAWKHGGRKAAGQANGPRA